jgi:hypothetical protein
MAEIGSPVPKGSRAIAAALNAKGVRTARWILMGRDAAG